MSIMRNRCVISFVIGLNLVCNADAMAAGPSVCGITLGQNAQAIPSDYDKRPTGSVTYINPNQPEQKITAERIEIRVAQGCQGLMLNASHNDEVPDIIIDVIEHRVVAFAFRPRIQDCDTVKSIVSSVLGPPSSFNVEVADWALQQSRQRVFVTKYSDDFCWVIHQQIESMRQGKTGAR